MGLSQGTVSELLSKPKHWDKLTEKGRESYRKMYNWSCSEQSINSLKAISPRKGNKDNYFYQSSNMNKEDAPPSTSSNQMVLDERIAKILSEANKQIQSNSNATSKLIYSASSPSGNEEISSQSQRSSTSNSPSMSPSSNQRKHLPLIKREASKDDYYISDNEKSSNNELNVSYFKQKNNNVDESDDEEEEDENRSKRNDESYPLDLTVKTNKNNNNNNLIPNMIQMMMMMKKRKLNDTHNDEYESGEEDEEESCKKSTLNMLKQLTNNSSNSNLAASINSSLNSLKHMQSITDSYLLTTAATAAIQNNNSNKSKIFNINHNASSSSLNNSNNNNKSSLFLQSPNTSSFSRPSSTPSPSLSLNNYNTNNGGKQLKCVLPPVSQEQFDKYSQINTDDLVRKVKDLLSKFSISQRLFGECILGLSQGSVSDLLARPKPWMMLTQKGREPFIRMQMFIDDPDAIKKLMANQYKTPGNDNNNSNNIKPVVNSNINTSTKTSSASSSNNSPNFNEPSNRNNYYQDNSNDSEMKPIQQTNFITSSNSTSNNNNNNNQTINIIPYDISALSAVGELNTDDITNRVKETLLNNNIGQKLFGEAVLNLSQGTVSELLSKPKPWNTLSIKGREPYLRMFMWLQDRYKLEKLNEWKEEKNLLKRNNANNNQNNNNTHDMNSANGDGSDHQKPKRRFIFSEEQKDQLMQAFKRDPYPAVNQMELLASQLGLQTRTVINWFHNHRMRIRYKNTTNSSSSNQPAISFNGRAGRTPAALFNQNNDFNNNKFSYSNNNSNNNANNNNDDMNGYEEDEDDEMNQYEMEPKSTKHHHDLHQSLDEEDEDESANNNEIDSLYIASNHNEDEEEDEDDDNQKDENENYINNQPNNIYNMINKHLQMLKNFNQIQQFNQQQQQDDKSMMSSSMSNNKRRKPHNPQKLNLINSQADSSTNNNNNNSKNNSNLPIEIMQKNAF